ncbi:MAG: BamA/TamA family outer membrane protein [Candidatus Cloacimonetes bacterium]|nr:BamA/TamA family outer membrane protein [Candidatus Cloacimonadota bacterium]MCF7814319.1 BamA/TamA family outer membrane protein [Candidatus Cloacimonadota bacterium]MCF7868396.1 BamA/TamA family outer membrane protein [Candidatus Cloacimonadota bacterium]MCF7883839.1 BamA/TamA family outer membrane protein [Candidatus Cloacimonadota bacterium]
MKRFFLLFFILIFFTLNYAEELRIGKIRFEGNESFSEQKLKQTIYSSDGAIYKQQTINDDAKRLSDLYDEKGILNVKILTPQIITRDPQNIDVIFVIQENDELKIRKLEISGNRYISKEKLSMHLDIENFPLSVLSEKLKSIIDYYAQNGFLFASVKLDSLVLMNNDYSAFVTISEGSFCEFDEYKFTGNSVTKDKTILRISQLSSAENITPEILQKAADNVQRKEYIKSCRIIPLNGKQALFQIEEDRMSLVSGVLGYDNSKQNEDRFAGYINVELMNLYGTDRSLAIYWKSLANDKNSIELKYHESGWQRYPVAGDFALMREEVDSTYISTQFNADIYVQDIKNKYGLYFGLEEIVPGSRRPKIIESNSYQKVGAFWNYSILDYFRNPTRGHEYFIKYYYIFNQQSNQNVSKQAVEFAVEYYYRLLGKSVIAAKLNAKVIENKKLKQFELFQMGGNNSLRGFQEDQFEGYRIAWTNLELRLLTSRNSRIYLFSDWGYAKNKEFSFSDLFGFGLGMNLQTRLGMLGITYGFSYQNGELRNPLDGIIHFGIESKL